MKYTIWNFVSDFYKYLGSQRLRFTVFLFLRYTSGALPYLSIFILGLIITLFTQEQINITLFYQYVGLIVIITITQIILRFYAKYQLNKISSQMTKEIRLNAMKQLLNLNLDWHESQNTGEKIQKINSGTEQIKQIMSSLMNDWINIIIGYSMSIILLTAINWRYGLYIIILSIMFFLIYKQFMPKLIRLQTELQILKEKVSGTFTESAYNITTIKALGLQNVFTSKSTDIAELYKQKEIETKKASQIRTVILLSLAAITQGIFLVWIGLDFIAGSIAIGMILTYYTYFGKYTDAQHKAIWEIQRVIDSKIVFERLTHILNATNTAISNSETIELQKWKSIQFTDVSFSYKDNITIENVSFQIQKGEKVAFVGKSGSGKSTLTKLLLQLYKPKTGQISIDKTPISKFTLKSLNSKIAIVMQESEMFERTISENITIGGEYNLQKLNSICKITELDAVIKNLPKKHNTIIGEKGYKLSGGERQRVAIARALYMEPELLVLDEATSALDSKTERKIIRNLQERFSHVTQVIIAHRLSTITHADKIYIMDKGRIIEKGTHAELLRLKKQYSKLWKLQHT